MRGRPRSHLDVSTESVFDEEVDEFWTAEGDPNDVLDEFAPSADDLLRGSSLAEYPNPQLGRVRALGLDVRQRTNDLCSALLPAQHLHCHRARLRLRTGPAGMWLRCGPAGLPTLRAYRHLPHFLPAGAHGGLHAGRQHRSVQRLRGDDLSSNANLDVSSLAGAVSDLPSRLRPGCRRGLRQLRRLRPVQRLFELVRRLLVVRYGRLQRLCLVGRMLIVYHAFRPVDQHAVTGARRHEWAAGYVLAIDRGIRPHDQWFTGCDAGGPRYFIRVAPHLRPRYSCAPDLTECARCRRFALRHVLSRSGVQRGQPHCRTAEDPGHPASSQQSQRPATSPSALATS